MNETKLTHAQIELLQYILKEHMFNTSLCFKEYTSLMQKLITMRAELEYFSITLEDQEIIDTL
jgi:hypothetical protein